MLGKLSVLSAAVLLAGGVGIAAAQQQPQSGAANQGKCFDRVSGQVKDKTAMANPPAKSTSGAPQPGEIKSGANPAGNAGTTGSAPPRPAAAAGLPDC